MGMEYRFELKQARVFQSNVGGCVCSTEENHCSHHLKYLFAQWTHVIRDDGSVS